MIFPWQQEQWQQFCRLHQSNRLPHALLLTGITGLGKTQFAANISHLLLCEKKNFIPHCDCHACHLLRNKVHPNVLNIEPEGATQIIKIEQIRQIKEFVEQSSFQGHYRLTIIHYADRMNIHAANALLKTLEEPARGALLILVSDQSECLPVTVRSRCQQFLFSRPLMTAALTWLEHELQDDANNALLLLKIAHGAPLAALRLIKEDQLAIREGLLNAFCLISEGANPIDLAIKIQHDHFMMLLDFALSWMIDLLRLQLGEESTNIINVDYEKKLLGLIKITTINRNIHFLNELMELRKQILHGVHVNKLLMLESILIRWAGTHQWSFCDG